MKGSCYNPIHHTELQKREDIAAWPYGRIGRHFFRAGCWQYFLCISDGAEKQPLIAEISVSMTQMECLRTYHHAAKREGVIYDENCI